MVVVCGLGSYLPHEEVFIKGGDHHPSRKPTWDFEEKGEPFYEQP